MTTPSRCFGALIAHDGVCLVEYRTERTGIRVVHQWTDTGRSPTIEEALDRLLALLAAQRVSRAKIAVAIEQFGVVHHVMTLPNAADSALRPVIQREIQRVFGIIDPVVSYSREDAPAAPGRSPATRADAQATPGQVFIAAASHATIDALGSKLASHDVQIATVVPKAIHSLYEATGGSFEPTAVLVCLEGGPHLVFFLDGHLEMAVDPPIALEDERASVGMILDQVERGAIYFRQQFRGAVATRMLLASRATEYDELSFALTSRLNVRVKPLFAGAASPEAVLAMGAVLETQSAVPLDLFPHPPTISERVAKAFRGPNAIMAAAASAAVIAGIWAATQFAALSSVRQDAVRLQAELRGDVASVVPMRQIAERRADFDREVAFVRDGRGERADLTASLQGIADQLPPGVRFDSVRVSRTATGWLASIGGEATGVTSAQAVRNLEAFYELVRARRGVSAPVLDQLDYPSSTDADAIRKPGAPIVIQFHVSFAVARPAEGGH
ncbi:MAG TPA: hypothetical protein VK636_05445 [Gemmatimonadaceae bacterium]|nr:hypothetical protein [Gemmatimonadaceae bacterium]